MAQGQEVELTPALVELHKRLRAEGVPIAEACKLAGHAVSVWYTWKKRFEQGENGTVRQFGEQVLGLTMQRGPLIEVSQDWRRLDFFEEWAGGLILDSGEPWPVEAWQLAAVEDVLSDLYQAVWLIVPEGNGKTTLVAAIVLYLLEHQLTAEIPIGSATVTQAETLFRQIEGFIVRSGKLKDFNLAPGVRRIDCRRTHGHTRVYPHNERSGDGVIPSGWVLDEGHLHPDLRLYRLWKGKYRKRRGIGMVISTAGEPTSEFEELRSSLLRDPDEIERHGPHVRAVTAGTVIHDWAVRDRADVEDMAKVAEANPLSTVDSDWLAEKHAEPEMTESHWLRRTCNIAAREDGQAVEPEDWDDLFEEGLVPDREAWSIGWLDIGRTIDTTALGVLVWEADTRRVVAGLKIIEPPVDDDDIVKALVSRQREFGPVGWVYDPNAGAQQMANLLEQGRHPDQDGVELRFIDHSQANAAMCLAAARLDEAIRNKWLVHDGDKGLRAHVLNAVRKSVPGERWRYDRPAGSQGGGRGKYPNDALIGLAMGHSVAVAEHQDSKEPLIAWS